MTLSSTSFARVPASISRMLAAVRHSTMQPIKVHQAPPSSERLHALARACAVRIVFTTCMARPKLMLAASGGVGEQGQATRCEFCSRTKQTRIGQTTTGIPPQSSCRQAKWLIRSQKQGCWKCCTGLPAKASRAAVSFASPRLDLPHLLVVLSGSSKGTRCSA